jgi:hypothetical protein
MIGIDVVWKTGGDTPMRNLYFGITEGRLFPQISTYLWRTPSSNPRLGSARIDIGDQTCQDSV